MKSTAPTTVEAPAAPTTAMEAATAAPTVAAASMLSERRNGRAGKQNYES
jgi:hypothetical protein